jgi:predicted transcriptional regulator
MKENYPYFWSDKRVLVLKKLINESPVSENELVKICDGRYHTLRSIVKKLITSGFNIKRKQVSLPSWTSKHKKKGKFVWVYWV